MPPNKVTIRPALSSDNPTDIAKLILLTDPYIYPVGFGSEGVPVLAGMIRDKSSVFRYDNIIIALEANRVIGQAVSIRYDLYEPINPDRFLQVYPTLTEAFPHMVNLYINHLPDYVHNSNEIYIACVSVLPDSRGQGIGSALIKYLIKNHHERIFKLHVLANNKSAISLYERHGFHIYGDAEPGYAYNATPPLCYEMIRVPE